MCAMLSGSRTTSAILISITHKIYASVIHNLTHVINFHLSSYHIRRSITAYCSLVKGAGVGNGNEAR